MQGFQRFAVAVRNGAAEQDTYCPCSPLRAERATLEYARDKTIRHAPAVLPIGSVPRQQFLLTQQSPDLNQVQHAIDCKIAPTERRQEKSAVAEDVTEIDGMPPPSMGPRHDDATIRRQQSE